jgi:hyperosmotically inducible periplasmic protein
VFRFRSLLSVVSVPSLLAVPMAVLLQVRPADDPTLRTKIEARLAEEALGDVEVVIQDRAVILGGTAPTRRGAKRAVEIAEDAAPDDSKVVSRMNVTASADDEALTESVAARLADAIVHDVFDSVEVEARDGVVTLRGYVTQNSKAKDLASAAAKVPGVRQVVNEVQALSPSMMDSDLRLRIAAEIYRDSVFSSQAALGRPNVHIAVDRGRVVLTGVVASELERAKAEALARSVPGSFEVVNRLSVEK